MSTVRRPNPRAFGMARELARPVARGWLSPEAAQAILIGSAWRSGVADPERLGNFLQWILRRHLEVDSDRRAIAERRVWRCVRPLLDQRAPSRQILVAAHDTNGAAGFALAEAEVTNLVAGMVAGALRQTVRGGAHGR